jgi:cytochrome c551/c552
MIWLLVDGQSIGAGRYSGRPAPFSEEHANTSKQSHPKGIMKNSTSKLAIVTAALFLAAIASASAGDAKEIWDKQCAKCHGPDGKGETKMGKKLGLKDFSDAKVQAELKDEEMLKAIKEGVKDKEGVVRMKPAEGVSDDDAKALVQYVRGLKK